MLADDEDGAQPPGRLPGEHASVRRPRRRLADLITGRGMATRERTDRLLGNAAFVWLIVGATILGYVLWRLLGPVLAVVGPVLLVAGLLVYALDPPVSALARRGIPRWVGTAALYLLIGGIVAGGLAVVGPLVGDQVAELAEEAPDLRQRGLELVNQGFASAGMDIELTPGTDGRALAREVAEETGAALEDDVVRQRLLAILGGVAGVAAGMARVLLLFAIGPVVAFYLLADLPRVRRVGRRVFPPERRDELVEVAAGMGRVVGGYVRGQLIVAFCVGVLATVGFALIGLPFWAIVGAIAGVTNLVPFVGPFVGGVIGVGVALLADGWVLALWVILVVGVVQQLESQVISPLVMGRTVHIHPVLVLLAVVVGGALFGVVGMVLSVPAVAAVKVLGDYLWQRHIPWAEGGGAHAASAPEGVLVERVPRQP